MTVRFADGQTFEIDLIGVSPISGQLCIGMHRMTFADALQLVSNEDALATITGNDGKQDMESFVGYTKVVGILQDVTGSLQIWLEKGDAE